MKLIKHIVTVTKIRILISVLCVVAMLMGTFSPRTVIAGTIIRYTAQDSIETAIEICEAIQTQDSSTIILASTHEDDLADLLCAAPLAGQENAPILLTPRETLDIRTAKKIADLKPETIYLLGDLSETVIPELRNLKTGARIIPLHGENSRTTALAINKELKDVKGTFVISGSSVADAVSISSFAAANRYQILLADENGFVERSRLIGTVYLVGGENSVHDIKGAKRLAGRDFYETNKIIVSTLPYRFNSIWIISGENPRFIDAFAAATAAAVNSAAIILVNPAETPADTDRELKKPAENSQCSVLGGENIISTDAVKSILTNLEMQWKPAGTWDELKSAVEAGRNVFLTRDIIAENDEDLWVKRSVIIDGQNHKFVGRTWIIASNVTFKNLNIELTQSKRNSLSANNAVVYSESNLRIEGVVTISGPKNYCFHGLFVENTLTINEKALLQVKAGKSGLFEGDGIKAGRLVVEDQALIEGIGGNGDNYSGTGIMTGTLILFGEPQIIGIGGQVQLAKDYNKYSDDPYQAMNEKNYHDHVGNGIQCGEFRSDPAFIPTMIARGGSIENNGFKTDPRVTGGCGFIITHTSTPNAQVVGYFAEDASMKTRHNLYYSVPYNVSGYAVYNHGKESLYLQTIMDTSEPAKDRVYGATWKQSLGEDPSDDDLEAMEKM
ncbi:MAG: cell wall-binding repeat-containing protein [Peptococcaceae bacterium]|nr:cell wall-binding repeat-containing protein [Peptococcaceae bacterium]